MRLLCWWWTLAILPWLLAVPVASRTWRDIETLHGMEPDDHFDVDFMLRATNPLNEPTPLPTTAPSLPGPTASPSAAPTTSSPTEAPSSAPTEPPDPYPFNEPPPNPDPWYFNYDTRDTAKYGPGTVGFTPRRDGGFDVRFMNNGWANVANPPNNYWKEFDKNGYGPWKDSLSVHSPEKNRCHRVGFQSPIDIKVTGKRKCEEHHEVRSLVGNAMVATGIPVHNCSFISNRSNYHSSDGGLSFER